MRIRILALIAGAGLLITGCAAPGDGPGAPASFSSPDDGHSALTASVTALAAGNYRFSRSGRHTVDGTVALPGGAALTVRNTPRDGFPAAAVITVGDEHFMKWDLFDGASKESQAKWDATIAAGKDADEVRQARLFRTWLPVLSGRVWAPYDPAVITTVPVPTLPTTQKPDVTGLSDLLQGVTSARRTGDTISGLLDATKVPEGQGLFGAEPVADLLGPDASAMPYTATLDAQGRLTNMTVEVPEVALSPSAAADPSPEPGAAPMFPGFKLIIKIADYGTATVPAKPAVTPLNREITTFLAEFD
jgi:hypothetical protein